MGELENFVKRNLIMADEAMAIAELRANWPTQPIAVTAYTGPRAPHLESDMNVES